jgi:hypothetical protein
MDPVTIAMALMAFGKAFKGITAFLGGKSEQKAAQAAALQAKQEAAVDANIKLDEGERISASAAVAAASGGGGTGSALNILEDLGRQASHNARTAIYRGATEASRYEFQGRKARAEGWRTLISETVDAASSFLGSSGQQGQMARAGGASEASRGMQAGKAAGAY